MAKHRGYTHRQVNERNRLVTSTISQIVERCWEATAGQLASSLRRSCIAQQHDVGLDVRAHNSEGLAVGRKQMVLDRVALKIRDLAAGRAIKRLQPQVVCALLVDNVDQPFSVRCKFRGLRKTGVGINGSDLLIGAGIQRN